MNHVQNRRLMLSGVAGACIGVLAGIVALWVSRAYTAGFSGADEPAHFLNGYFVSSYIRDHLGANPMAFATDFYIHYPKISIGHWPPAYYGFLGLLFLVLPATPELAFLINLFVSALPAAGVAVGLGYLAGRRTALVGAVVYSLAPLVTEGQSFFMLDQALAACCVAATIVWVAYAERPGWRRAFLFSALCALAVLMKGNGWLLVLVPLYHMLLTGRWTLLASAQLFVAAVAGALVVVPWYWLTTGIAADGFNYQAGWHYALTALGANLAMLVNNIGYPGLLLALVAVISEYRTRLSTPLRWSALCGCVSLILATLTLQSLVPVDIIDRYLAPALPAVVVLALIGIVKICTLLRGRPVLALSIGALFVMSMLAPGILHLVNRIPKTDFRMEEVVSHVSKDSHQEIWLVDGNSGAEGAFIAEMAVRDPALQRYAVRASKILAETNFMGTQYHLKFTDPASVLAEIRRLGVQNIVVVRVNGRMAFPHSALILDALQLPDSPFRKTMTLIHRNRPGVTDVYQSAVTALPNVVAVRQLGLPEKASSVTRLQP